MKLYYSPGACSLSVHITLCESGLAFSTEKVDLKRKTTESGADYNAINAKGYVPALQLDNGELLTEVQAIVQYLADRAPASGIAPPPGSFERVRLQEWLSFIGSELHKTFSPLWRPAPEETRAAAIARLDHWFDWLAPQLAQRPYLMGEHFTVADAYLFTVLNWTHFLSLSLARWPALQDYLQRLAARPAVAAAMRSEGLTT
jgi:glutathione S-transferase